MPKSSSFPTKFVPPVDQKELYTPARIRFQSIEPLLEHLGPIKLKGINWVIVGGESGPGARPMDGDWVRDIRAQCHRAKVAFFFKQ